MPVLHVGLCFGDCIFNELTDVSQKYDEFVFRKAVGILRILEHLVDAASRTQLHDKNPVISMALIDT